jgi:hypothetical protein
MPLGRAREGRMTDAELLDWLDIHLKKGWISTLFHQLGKSFDVTMGVIDGTPREIKYCENIRHALEMFAQVTEDEWKNIPRERSTSK